MAAKTSNGNPNGQVEGSPGDTCIDLLSGLWYKHPGSTDSVSWLLIPGGNGGGGVVTLAGDVVGDAGANHIKYGVVLKDENGDRSADFSYAGGLYSSGFDDPVLNWSSGDIILGVVSNLIGAGGWTIDPTGNAVNLKLANCTAYDLSSSGPNPNTDGSGLDLTTFQNGIGTSGNGVDGLVVGSSGNAGFFNATTSGGILMSLPGSDPFFPGRLWQFSGDITALTTYLAGGGRLVVSSSG